MSAEKTYQPTKRCPKCKKRYVYLQITTRGANYVCQVDGFTWKAYDDGSVEPSF
jgi:hypothetical protein